MELGWICCLLSVCPPRSYPPYAVRNLRSCSVEVLTYIELIFRDADFAAGETLTSFVPKSCRNHRSPRRSVLDQNQIEYAREARARQRVVA